MSEDRNGARLETEPGASEQTRPFSINGRLIGPGRPVYIIAELSANHRQDERVAQDLVRAAAGAGADAVKLQTYTAETITIDSDSPPFRIGKDSLWAGRTLHDLYLEASMPWEWQPGLKKLAEELGMDCFSSPFDDTAIDFLEAMAVPAYKVASFELVDLPLIRRMAATGRPLIISTGMASAAEVDEAIGAAQGAGAKEIALLKCTSAYPTPPEEMHLRAIPMMIERWGLPVGLSDHTAGHVVPVAAVALGASIVEKHFTISRDDPSPDSAFSLEVDEFAAMVKAIRETEAALSGPADLEPTAGEVESRRFRRSLFAVEEIAAGEILSPANVRSIRPSDGLHTREYEHVLGRRAARAIPRGTPLTFELLAPESD
jgi:N-acetylneuraminate synthase